MKRNANKALGMRNTFFYASMHLHDCRSTQNGGRTKKSPSFDDDFLFSSVGVTGFEPATTRPPDAYSNRAELHPEEIACGTYIGDSSF